jgi:sugar phosphate isomerase/epimerase
VLKSVKGLGLVYDSANFYHYKEDPYLAIQKLLPYVSRVHLKDRALTADDDKLAFLNKNGEKTSVYPLGEGECQMDKIISYLLKNSSLNEFVLEGIKDCDMEKDTLDSVIYLTTRIKEYESGQER